MSHVCETCGASFSRPSKLTIHQRIHTGERPFKCVCGRSYIRRQHLTRHSTKCTGQPSICQKPKSLLNKSLDFTEYSCPKCGAGPFSKKKSVWAHMAIVHGERRFKCKKCDAAFPTKSKLDRHLTRHHDLQCPKCALILSDSTSIASRDLPDPNERFENFIELRLHIAKAHPKQVFTCTTCDAQFPRLARLREHEATHVPLEERRTFVCVQCSLPKMMNNDDTADDASLEASIPVAYASKRSLLAHIRAVHASRVRRYPCTHADCPAILSTKQKLQAHLTRHGQAASISEVVRVFQRPSLNPRGSRSHPSSGPECESSPKRRRKCVPLRDMQDAWETESQSSVLAGLHC
ncbi:hypothetical protein Aperf_G00000063438 [Anoplocephala perfoliata]